MLCDPIDHGGSSFPVASPPIFVFCGAFQNRQLARPGSQTVRSGVSSCCGASAHVLPVHGCNVCTTLRTGRGVQGAGRGVHQ